MASVAWEERWGDNSSVDERREAILRHVGLVVREQGFASLKMQDIADRLNMTKGNLYYYFKNKQDLLFHCHMKCMEISLAALTEAERGSAKPGGRLRRLLVAHIKGIIEDSYGAVLLTDLEDLTAEQRKTYVRMRDKFERGVRKIIDQGMASGEFRKIDPRLAGFAILGSINWMPKWYRPDGKLSADSLADGFADFFMHALGV
jgi:AcrR family transcriptional regulator